MKVIALSNIAGFNEAEQLSGIVRAAPAEGYTLDDVRKALKIIAQLEGTGPLTLEDAEHAFLVNMLNSRRWNVALPEIVALVDKITQATDALPH